MLKGEQAIMGLKTYEKEAAQNKHVNAKTRQTKNQGFQAMAYARKNRPTYAIKLACTSKIMRRKSLPRRPKNTKIEHKQKP